MHDLSSAQLNLLNLIRRYAPIRIECGAATSTRLRNKIVCPTATFEKLLKCGLIKVVSKGYKLTPDGENIVGPSLRKSRYSFNQKPRRRPRKVRKIVAKSPEQRLMELVFGK